MPFAESGNGSYFSCSIDSDPYNLSMGPLAAFCNNK